MNVRVYPLTLPSSHCIDSLTDAAIEATRDGGGIGWDPKKLADPSAQRMVRRWFVQRIENPLVSVLVATPSHDVNFVLGSVQLVRPDHFHSSAAAHRAEVSKLFVRPTARGQGIARLLMQSLIHEATIRGVAQLNLDVRITQEVALHLYASLGFVEFGRCEDYARTDAGSIAGSYMALKL